MSANNRSVISPVITIPKRHHLRNEIRRTHRRIHHAIDPVCGSSRDPGVAAAGTTPRTRAPVVAKPAPAAISQLVHRYLVAAPSDRPNVPDLPWHKLDVHSIHALFVKQQPAPASRLASELFLRSHLSAPDSLTTSQLRSASVAVFFFQFTQALDV